MFDSVKHFARHPLTTVARELDEFADVRFFGKNSPSPNCDAFFLKQIHGSEIVSYENNKNSDNFKVEADGSYTSEIGRTLGIQTADCLPIIFAAPDIAMAVHAGWRGLAKGILNNASEILRTQLQGLEKVKVAIGPAICTQHFEVDWDCVDAFIKSPHITKDESLFGLSLCKGKGEKWHLDLKLIAHIELLRMGFLPENIFVCSECTFCDSENWHSYRRDGAAAGRNYTYISFRGQTPPHM